MLKQLIQKTALIAIISSTATTVTAENYYQVRVHNLSPPVTLSGTVIPEKEVTLLAQLPGRIEKIAGKEGDEFKQSTILIALNDRELLAKRRAAIASWRNADAALRNAGMQYSRELWSPDSPSKAPGGMGLPNLFDQFLTKPLSDVLGQSDQGLDRRAQMQSFGSKIEQARGGLEQAKSQIEQIDSKLRDAQSIAPFDGVIIKKMVEVGDTVMMGQPLLQFADIRRLQIEVDVPARLVRGLNVGQRLSANLDVLNEPIIVNVAQIFPVADRQRHTVKVKFDLSIDKESEQGRYVGPGQYAQVDVPDVKAGQQKLLLIPKIAVMRRGSLPSVCVLKQNNKYERRVIRLGRSINPRIVNDIDPSLGDYVTILSGLKEGDEIVINNNRFRKPPC
jgi:RND family efflux transporter MFP subunit